MRDGIDCRIAPVFTVDQLAARSNFGSSGRQLFCARLRLPLIGQSKIIRRTTVTRRDPHTCCGQNVITRLESASFFLAWIHHRCLFSIHCRSSPFIVRPGTSEIMLRLDEPLLGLRSTTFATDFCENPPSSEVCCARCACCAFGRARLPGT